MSYAAPPPGVFVPVPTFFKAPTSTSSLDTASYKSKPIVTAALDIETQTAHTLHLARNGIKGIVFLGSTGETPHFNRDERKLLVSSQRKALTEAGFADYPIMVGVLTNSTADAIEQLHDAKESGAQWGLVLAPGYFAGIVQQDSLRAWWLEVAEASPLPFLLYHYPGVTNNIAVTTETYNLLAQHPKIVGAKLSHGDLSQFTQITQSPLIKGKTAFNMFCGLGQLLLPVLLLGGSGVIDGLASVFPKSIVHLYGLASKRDMTFEDREKALKVQYMVSCAEEIFGKWGIIGVKDAIHKYLGMGNLDGGRNPIGGCLGEEGWKPFKAAFDNLKAFEDSL